MITIAVKASRDYDILIASGLLGQLGDRAKALHPNAAAAAIVTDDTVGQLYLKQAETVLKEVGFSVVAYSISPGEASKNGTQYLHLLDWLAERQITRSDIIIALGGGVVGDLAGFAAATYLRGVTYIQIPTTLLAMVDSSVGGKTAIDLKAGKNLAGVFYQPSAVLCDPDVLDTLPEPVFQEGIAEVIKCGMIGDGRLLDQLLNEPIQDNLSHIIAACVTIKRDIVERDEFDHGERQVLNFGHTVGHAIERLCDYSIPHGHAVAIGMMVETRGAVKKKLCPPECLYLLESLLHRFQLPGHTDYSAQELYTAALYDKKRAGDEITLVIPREIGRCELMTLPVAQLLAWIEAGCQS